MIDIIIQKKGRIIAPFSTEDLEALSEFHDNQKLRAKITSLSAKKEYHIEQLAHFFLCCTRVANNTEKHGWTTKDNVAFQCKVALHFVDTSAIAVSPDGTVQFKYRSISLDSMKYLEACDFFKRSYELMAGVLGNTVEELTRDDR